MKKLALSFALTFVLAPAAFSAPFELTFTPSVDEADGKVSSYSAWYQLTNAPDANQWIWLGAIPAGYTNILFESTNFPANPVWLTATASGTNNTQSYNAEPILFDTNDFIVVVTNVAPLRPAPPTLLKIIRL